MKPNEIVKRKKRAAAIRRHENHHGFCSQTHSCNSSTSNANPHSRQIAQHGSSRNHYIANYAHNCTQSNPITGSNFPNNSFNTDHHQHHKIENRCNNNNLSRPYNQRKYTKFLMKLNLANEIPTSWQFTRRSFIQMGRDRMETEAPRIDRQKFW